MNDNTSRGDRNYDHISIEDKWQKRWFSAGINHADRMDGKRKFFLIFAYPGISGYLHVGHMRGFTYADVITRYKRLRGYNVLFPAGFHATGLPAVSLAKRVDRGDKDTLEYLRRNGCPEDIIPKLKDPEFVVKYFSEIYMEDYWKKFGFLIDYRRAMTTIDLGYKRFIQWQFRRLNEKGLLITKPHYAPYCPNCGPVAVDPSETDVSTGGNAEILEFTVIKFKLGEGIILPAATLRPETIFGVTNMWLNPTAHYVAIEYKGERWIVSHEAYRKMMYQKGESNIRFVCDYDPRTLLGKYVEVPFTGKKVPVLPSEFVSADVATGIVMSVPAHAPYDWIALKDLKHNERYRRMLDEYSLPYEIVDNIKPIPLIKNSPWGNDPAGAIIKDMGISDQNEGEKLEEATKRIYKEEFHTGILNHNCMEYEGMRISEAKEMVIDDLLRSGMGDRFLEFSEKVLCRCNSPVYIARVPEQWFIKYSDEDLTERSKAHAKSMVIIPEDYYKSLPGILDWYGDRACIRQGSWLGTEFPFKENWIIEPISDSTLYPAYYIISKYINSGELSEDDLTDELFDYVFCISDRRPEGVGDVIDNIRKDFEYWYPLDINLGGKEHMTVHFPVFLMNHVAIMPERFWPKGIFVHWWIIQKGGKISKSKGGAEPIPDAARIYGVDTMRLYYCHVGNPNMDVEWSPDTVLNYKKRIERIYELYTQIIDDLKTQKMMVSTHIDRWILSRMKYLVDSYIEAMDRYDLRTGSNIAFFEFPAMIRWYIRRGGNNNSCLREVIRYAILMIAPITPHIAEDLWDKSGNHGFVSLANLEVADHIQRDILIEVLETEVRDLINDIAEIKSVTGMDPKTIYIYTPAEWKYIASNKVARRAIDGGKGRINIGPIIKDLMQNEDIKKYGKEIPRFVSTLAKDITRMSDDMVEAMTIIDSNTEHTYIQGSADFIANAMECDSIYVVKEDDESIYDPKNRARASKPLKPGIYLE